MAIQIIINDFSNLPVSVLNITTGAPFLSNKISANLPKLLKIFTICLISLFPAWNHGYD